MRTPVKPPNLKRVRSRNRSSHYYTLHLLCKCRVRAVQKATRAHTSRDHTCSASIPSADLHCCCCHRCPYKGPSQSFCLSDNQLLIFAAPVGKLTPWRVYPATCLWPRASCKELSCVKTRTRHSSPATTSTASMRSLRARFKTALTATLRSLLDLTASVNTTC